MFVIIGKTQIEFFFFFLKKRDNAKHGRLSSGVLTEDSSKCRMDASGFPQRGRAGRSLRAAGTDAEV